MSDRLLVALGGNALAGSRECVRESLSGVVELAARGHSLVVTHGNRPQVDRCERPLHARVAQSQGETGWLLAAVLTEAFRRRGIARPVACVITQAVVSSDPRPRRIVEAPTIRTLFEAGTVVIAAGGGGIPVRDDFEGVDAVVDMDHASAALALALDVEAMLVLTSVPNVTLDYGTPRERPLSAITASQARRFLAAGHFAPGSMGPKIEASIDFIAGGGREVVIAAPPRALDALAGRAGTRITDG